MKLLTKHEEILLYAIYKLRDDAYGAALKRYVFDVTGKDWNYGNLYCTLDQLTKKKYITKTIGDPSSERGGRSKNFYHLTNEGTNALKEALELNNRMVKDIKELALLKR